MINIKATHRQAMEQLDSSVMARMQGDHDDAIKHLHEAYRLESLAAISLTDAFDKEPTRSVLFRSAATLARDCGENNDAERLIFRALSGTPPADIAQELRDLLEELEFGRHLDLRGVRSRHKVTDLSWKIIPLKLHIIIFCGSVVTL